MRHDGCNLNPLAIKCTTTVLIPDQRFRAAFFRIAGLRFLLACCFGGAQIIASSFMPSGLRRQCRITATMPDYGDSAFIVFPSRWGHADHSPRWL
jgi:hypothetical protein